MHRCFRFCRQNGRIDAEKTAMRQKKGVENAIESVRLLARDEINQPCVEKLNIMLDLIHIKHGAVSS